MAWDFGNNLNWDLVQRQVYHAQTPFNDPERFLPIPTISVLVDSRTLLIGARNALAKSHWYLAAIVGSNLFASPSSTSEFMAAVQPPPRFRIGLNRLNLVRFDDYGLSPYLLEIYIPRWHKQMLLEIWKYSGTDGSLEADLARVEAKIDAL